MIDQLRQILDPITANMPHETHDAGPDAPWNDSSQPLKSAAVLVPFISRAAGWHVLLTKRADDMPSHGGQISFPGGTRQNTDPHLSETALREFEEETGVLRSYVRLLGRFASMQTGTGFHITPFVGEVFGDFTIRPDPREVAEIFEVPFSIVMDLRNFTCESVVWQGRERSFYALQWQNHYIWGATAGMLRDLALKLARNEACDD